MSMLKLSRIRVCLIIILKNVSVIFRTWNFLSFKYLKDKKYFLKLLSNTVFKLEKKTYIIFNIC